MASTSPEDCVCDAGFYDSIIGPGVLCKICPTGTDCAGGATLDRLPLKRSFFRKSNHSVDVRQCPDATANCSTNFGKSTCYSTSGCLGGESVDDQCNTSTTGLTGIFCATCALPPEGAEPVYYVAAKDGDDAEAAHCEGCGNTFSVTVLITGLVVVVVLVLVPLLLRVKHAYKKRLDYIAEVYSPMAKTRILFNFYMIVTKIGKVYSVFMPQEVRTALSYFSMAIAFGLNGVATTPLECLGLSGYVPRLIFWILLPIALCLIVFSVTATNHARKARMTHKTTIDVQGTETRAGPARASRQKKSRKKHSVEKSGGSAAAGVPTLLESTLPLCNLIMFLLYPRVTQIAFEGFPCYELDDGSGYLIVDVAIECRTPEHDNALVFVWIAVIAYPIGLMAFNSLLLFLASKAIQEGKETPLSRSIGFLYKEFEVTCFWWEIAEMLRKFLLVGLFIVIESGTVTQIALATIFCAVYLLIQMQVRLAGKAAMRAPACCSHMP